MKLVDVRKKLVDSISMCPLYSAIIDNEIPLTIRMYAVFNRYYHVMSGTLRGYSETY